MPQSDFWLYQWLDSYLVKRPQEALRLLKEPSAREALRQAAYEVTYDRPAIDKSGGQSIVAGAGLDLSGSLDCIHWECIKKQVDALFNSVWHYFDNVVVVGPSAVYMSTLWKKSEPDEAWINYALYNFIRALLYIRNIGAEDLLVFAEKPHAWCDHHFTVLLNEIGVQSKESYEQYLDELGAEIERNAKFKTTIDPKAHELAVTCTAPQFFDGPKVKTQRLGPSFSRPKNELRSEIARSLAYDHTTYLLQDIAAAQNLGAPLGATNKFHRRILASTNYEITEAEVAFHINLPILHGVEPEVLYKLREDEKEHFQAFRNSLKTAIRERLDRIGEQDAESIGEEIRQDVIEPSLNEIDRRLNLARKALAKKATTSVVVGALATTCGLLTANPIMVSTGVGATMTALPATHKYIEERRDVTLSDMYFLWNAKRHIQERR